MPTPVLSPLSDDAPCPRVVVLVSDLPAAAVTATLYCTANGRREEVRGAYRVAVAGVLSVIDFEAPLDVELTYQAQWFNSAGTSLGWSEPATTIVVSPRWQDGQPRLLLHNPLDPRTAVWVRPESEAAAEISRPTPGEVRWADGRRLGLVQAGRRRGLVKVPLPVITETREDGDRFDALFGTPDVQRLPILCVRLPYELDRMRLPPRFFAGVLSAPAEPHHSSDVVVWRMVFDEVAAPVPTLVMPLLRRRDIAAYYGSRQAVAAANASRLALARRFEIAGSGGA